MQTTIVPKIFFFWGGGEGGCLRKYGLFPMKPILFLSVSMLGKDSIHCPISLGGCMFLGIKTLLVADDVAILQL